MWDAWYASEFSNAEDLHPNPDAGSKASWIEPFIAAAAATAAFEGEDQDPVFSQLHDQVTADEICAPSMCVGDGGDMKWQRPLLQAKVLPDIAADVWPDHLYSKKRFLFLEEAIAPRPASFHCLKVAREGDEEEDDLSCKRQFLKEVYESGNLSLRLPQLQQMENRSCVGFEEDFHSNQRVDENPCSGQSLVLQSMPHTERDPGFICLEEESKSDLHAGLKDLAVACVAEMEVRLSDIQSGSPVCEGSDKRSPNSVQEIRRTIETAWLSEKSESVEFQRTTATEQQTVKHDPTDLLQEVQELKVIKDFFICQNTSSGKTDLSISEQESHVQDTALRISCGYLDENKKAIILPPAVYQSELGDFQKITIHDWSSDAEEDLEFEEIIDHNESLVDSCALKTKAAELSDEWLIL